MKQGAATENRRDTHIQEEPDLKDVRRILQRHGNDRGALIAILGAIQDENGYLSEQALRMVSEKMDRSLVDIYALATFYGSFSLQPRGKHLITVCLGTACHVRGGQGIAKEFERQLGIKAGETTPDREFTLETVNCLGACALGPVVVIDGHYFSKVRESRVNQLLHEAIKGFEKTDIDRDERVFPIEVNCPRCNHSLMDKIVPIDAYPSIRIRMSFGNKHGWLRLSSLYGSHNISTEHDIPADTVVKFSCPHCSKELVGAWKCPICGATMAPMSVSGGGMLQICTRRGCKGHMLDLNTSTL